MQKQYSRCPHVLTQDTAQRWDAHTAAYLQIRDKGMRTQRDTTQSHAHPNWDGFKFDTHTNWDGFTSDAQHYYVTCAISPYTCHRPCLRQCCPSTRPSLALPQQKLSRYALCARGYTPRPDRTLPLQHKRGHNQSK